MTDAAFHDVHQEEEEIRAGQADRQLLFRLLRYLGPYRGRVILTVALLVVVSALGIAGPLVVKYAIDKALQDPSAPDRMGALLRITGFYVGVLAVGAALQYAQVLLLQSTGQHVMHDLRMQLFRHVLRQDMRYFDHQPVGRIMTRLTSDIEAVNELFTSGVVTVAMDVLTLVAIMGVMLWMDWQLALLSFAVIPLLFVLSMFFRSRVRRAFRKIRVRVARVNSFLQEHLAGIAVVQTFGQGPRRLQRFDKLNWEHTAAHLETVAAFAVFFPAVETISTGAVTLLLWRGTDLVVSGAVTLGTLVAFVQYAQRFYRPISDLSEKFNILQGAMAASERIFELLDTAPTIEAPDSPVQVTRVEGEVRFEDVHFHYQPLGNGEKSSVKPVLRGLSFHVKPGERVAIVGSTGAGKTTVISLLTRFYDTQSGRILVDGVDIRDWDPQVLRRQVGVVLQDPRLFSGSLRENLTLGRSDFDPATLERAIDRIGLDRLLSRLPGGLEEEMREGGNRLSTGERQLVAFARALAHDPPILVLDEATASVDPETEQRIQHAIEELLRGRTSLVIAHRLSTVRTADRILVLHAGRLHESGTHDELMEANGLYRRLVEMQLRPDPA